MMTSKTVIHALALALTLAILASAVSVTQAADERTQAKPTKTPTATPAPTAPPPPLDGGTVYYYESGTTTMAMHKIQSDGSQDTLVGGITGAGGTQPSRQKHNGERWFVTLRDLNGTPGFFPGGASGGRLWELDLVREGDLARFPLTDFAATCIHMWGGDPGIRYDWAPDASGQIDGAIAWLGARWEDVDDDGDCDQPVEGGIFRGAVSIDGSGNVAFSQPTAPEVVVALSGTSTRAGEFAWAPDGQKVAYKDKSGEDLWVATVGGSRSMIFGGRLSSFFPINWSPDLDPSTAGYQARIAFTGAVTGSNGADTERGTYTIAPDGSGRVRIATAKLPKKSSDPTIWHYAAYWSPAGNQVAYTERIYSYNPTAVAERLHRVNASGTNDVVLVDTSSAYSPFGRAWTTD